MVYLYQAGMSFGSKLLSARCILRRCAKAHTTHFTLQAQNVAETYLRHDRFGDCDERYE